MADLSLRFFSLNSVTVVSKDDIISRENIFYEGDDCNKNNNISNWIKHVSSFAETIKP